MSLPHNHTDGERAPFILMSAPNGARLQKSDHMGLPIAPKEIAAEAEALVDAGVSVLHLHIRDADGGHSLDTTHYHAAIQAIRAAIGDQIIIQVTTEAVGIYSRQEQMNMVRTLRPEAVSLALRELCPDEDAVPEAAAFFRDVQEMGCWPQYILYSADDVRRFHDYARRGIFADDTPFTLYVLGRYNENLVGNPADLNAFIAATQGRVYPWAVCCFGPTESQAIKAAYDCGGHGRIGFENNQILPGGGVASSNHQLISQALTAAGITPGALARVGDVRQSFIANYSGPAPL